jgi:DNA polymerase-2
MLLEAWFFDVYPAPGGMATWWIGEDGARLSLSDPWRPALYVDAAAPELPVVRRRLETDRRVAGIRLEHRREFWSPTPGPVLRVEVVEPGVFDSLVRTLGSVLGPARLFNADLPLGQRYCYERALFPLARCRVEADGGVLRSVQSLDSPWTLAPRLPALRVLELVPADGVPYRLPGAPLDLLVRAAGQEERLDGARPLQLLERLRHLLESQDPDLLLSDWGDELLFPALVALAGTHGVALPLDREPVPLSPLGRGEEVRGVGWGRVRGRGAVVAKSGRQAVGGAGRSYLSYGRVLYRGPAYPLRGRWHVDRRASFFFGETGLEGLLETARLARVPVQRMARTTPGTAITSMQLELAVRGGVLVPWKKREPEAFKSGLALLAADKGGLVYRPSPGAYAEVGELDFASMYPAIMVHHNVSPETVNCACCGGVLVPEDGYRICWQRDGLMRRVLGPLVERRRQLKEAMQAAMGAERLALDRRQTALKWIGVVSFGYLGYHNARFGRIEAHEAITAFGREALLRAKERAEARGFRMLHGLTDCLWLQRRGAGEADYAALAREIGADTGIPVSVEGIYRWIVFCPARILPKTTVPNRFFGVFEDGRIKARGIEFRRDDTPPLVRAMQERMLAVLATARDLSELRALAPRAERIAEAEIERVFAGQASPSALVVTRRLSMAPEEYVNEGLQALAARQLLARGLRLEPGQSVQYLVVSARARNPRERVLAVPLVDERSPYDRAFYADLCRQATATLLDPLT